VTIRYTLSPEAKRDIEQIRDYYLEEAGARVARHVLGRRSALSGGNAGGRAPA
jgi:plasmid stabilization system protein ParE